MCLGRFTNVKTQESLHKKYHAKYYFIHGKGDNKGVPEHIQNPKRTPGFVSLLPSMVPWRVFLRCLCTHLHVSFSTLAWNARA
jgi:hypothetical protein